MHLDAFPGLKFTAHFDSASPVATAPLGSPVKTFTARFRLDQSDPHLLPDLSAAVDIEAPHDSEAPDLANIVRSVPLSGCLSRARHLPFGNFGAPSGRRPADGACSAKASFSCWCGAAVNWCAALRSVDGSAGRSGSADRLAAPAGSAVKKGQAVIRFDPSRTQQDLKEKMRLLARRRPRWIRRWRRRRITADQDKLDLATAQYKWRRRSSKLRSRPS